MPTNVPPQYREAEQRFRDATSVQGKIAALQEMLQIMPKHKGTDHLKAQLRSRLSKLMNDLETELNLPCVDPIREGAERLLEAVLLE